MGLSSGMSGGRSEMAGVSALLPNGLADADIFNLVRHTYRW